MKIIFFSLILSCAFASEVFPSLGNMDESPLSRSEKALEQTNKALVRARLKLEESFWISGVGAVVATGGGFCVAISKPGQKLHSFGRAVAYLGGVIGSVGCVRGLINTAEISDLAAKKINDEMLASVLRAKVKK